MIQVSGLFVYPIKSCRGIGVQAFRLDRLGPQLDRHFMVIDAEGKFLTQREEPRLALVGVALHPTALVVTASGRPTLKLPLSVNEDAPVIEADIWKYHGPTLDAGDEAHDWFSDHLHRPCRLVRFPPAPLRRVSPRYSPEEAYTTFSDGYPELLIGEASLADLARRAGRQFPIDRFRPNILVSGSEPYAEDSWKRIRIGQLELDVVKPCSRCVITTVDQTTGVRGTEPLATLASYRKQGNAVLFGQNCVHRGFGTIRVGDPVEVLATQPPVPPDLEGM